MTFDLHGHFRIEKYTWESFAACRQCGRATIFVLSSIKPPFDPGVTAKDVTVRGHVSVADDAARPSPEHVPESIAAAFQEGAKCLAIGCFNAAAAMFRLAVDLATVDLLPGDEAERPNAKTCRDLGLRLPWLFANGKLPNRLKDLADVVKDDGNDAAHRGTVDQETDEALVEFTERLLTELYTEPAKIEIAKERRAQRKAGQPASALLT